MAKVTEEDIEIARTILDTYEGSFVGGSYIVNSEEANDIDILISPDQWYKNYLWLKSAYPQWKYKDNGAIDAGYSQDHEINVVAYVGKVNLIVSKPDFIPAYKAAVVEMRRNPELYQTRDERVELHQSFKNKIREMINGFVYRSPFKRVWHATNELDFG